MAKQSNRPMDVAEGTVSRVEKGMATPLTISNQTRPSAPPAPLDPATLDFGKNCSPNFLVMDYRNGEWGNARVQPIEPFKMHPATSVLHYAQTIFEGMKA